MQLRGILDRIVLVVAVLAAACVPSFVAQYRQRLGGRLDQALQDLNLFQEIANRNHGGDLNRLIKHHLASSDVTFRDEGIAIQKMVDTVATLRESVAALNADIWSQLAYLLQRGDLEMAKATWSSFVPAVNYTPEALLFAFAMGVVIWLLFVGTWMAIAGIIALGGSGISRGPRVARSSAGSTPSRGAPPRH
jgi:type II secretory pathway pseudopilin PulG